MKKFPIRKSHLITDNTVNGNRLLWLIYTPRMREALRFEPFTKTEWHIRHLAQTVALNAITVSLNPYNDFVEGVKVNGQIYTIPYPSFYEAEKHYPKLSKLIKKAGFKPSYRIKQGKY